MTNAVWKKTFARIHVALAHNISKVKNGALVLGTPIITLIAIMVMQFSAKKKANFLIVFMDI